MPESLLNIDNLTVAVEGQTILHNFCLRIGFGEVHAIMGPNGSGKSTLARVLAGEPGYEIQSGKIEFLGEDLLALEPHERACKGLFLAFQYPIEIPGISNMEFLKIALDSIRKAKNEPPLGAAEFIQKARAAADATGLAHEFLKRGVNEGFSGGEKKRNEIMQMALLEPTLGILDETDSGLDIDALQVLSASINQMRIAKRSFIVITHYQRLLNYVVPDYVHVISGGQIIKFGGRELALELEEKGYGWLAQNTPVEAAGATRDIAGT